MNAFVNTFTSLFRTLALTILAAALVACGSSASDREAGDVEPSSNSGLLERVIGEDTKEVTVPSGTQLVVELQDGVSSSTSKVGDMFRARVVEPVSMNGEVVIEAGSEVTGLVTQAVRSKRIGGKARLGLELTGLELPSGEEGAISGAFYREGKSQTKKDAATIGGAAAGGAILGRVIGHDRGKEADGTAVGAIVGAAVGTGIAASNRGQDIVLPEGTKLSIHLAAPVRLTVDA
jgi:hypothetical protein